MPVIRSENLREILDVLVQAGPGEALGREAIADRSGISHATVVRGLAYLRELNQALAPESRVLKFIEAQGRTGRAEHVRLLDTGAVTFAFEFSHNRITVARADVWGRVLSRHDWWSDKSEHELDAHASIDLAADEARMLMRDTPLSRLVGVAVAVAAPLDPVDRVVTTLKTYPEYGKVTWAGLDPARELAKRLYDWPAAFLVDNDANFAAVAEYRWLAAHWRRTRPLRDFVHVKWSSGIGSALIIGGHMHRGFMGVAGEFGHTPVRPLEAQGRTYREPCERCGRLDCLENVASYDAMKKEIGFKGTRRDFEKDPRGRAAIEAAAVVLGRALGQVVNVLNPQAIAISGPSPQLHSMIVQRVRLGLNETAVAVAARDIELYVAEPRWRDVDDQHGRLAVASGAIARVVEERSGRYLLALLNREEPGATFLAQAS